MLEKLGWSKSINIICLKAPKLKVKSLLKIHTNLHFVMFMWNSPSQKAISKHQGSSGSTPSLVWWQGVVFGVGQNCDLPWRSWGNLQLLQARNKHPSRCGASTPTPLTSSRYVKGKKKLQLPEPYVCTLRGEKKTHWDCVIFSAYLAIIKRMGMCLTQALMSSILAAQGATQRGHSRKHHPSRVTLPWGHQSQLWQGLMPRLPRAAQGIHQPCLSQGIASLWRAIAVQGLL